MFDRPRRPPVTVPIPEPPTRRRVPAERTAYPRHGIEQDDDLRSGGPRAAPDRFSSIPINAPSSEPAYGVRWPTASPRLTLQPKLAIGAEDHPLEREADRTADRVMRMADPTVAPVSPRNMGVGDTLQRGCAACEQGEEEIQRKTSRADLPDVEAPQIVHEVLGSPGQPLDAETRAFMEPRFGRRFENVRVHADERASAAANAISAHAFTAGSHIAFGAGRYEPGSGDGRYLLAHELAHVVQQSGRVAPDSGDVQRQPDSGANAPTPPSTCAPPEKVNAAEKRYRDMIAAARKRGALVAADNLEHFLDGSGTKRILSVAWLRSFSEVTDAERTNQDRFEKSLYGIAKTMKHGETRTFADKWDRMLTAGLRTELYYASGTSTIHSMGTFSLSQIENQITIDGIVSHHWFDPYDWHPGLGAWIPGFGDVKDEDGVLMQDCRGAKPFDMESDWQQRLTGTVKINFLLNDVSFRWSGP